MIASVRAGGGGAVGDTLILTAEPVAVSAAALAAGFLLPPAWLFVVTAVGQVSWPRWTGTQRRAGLLPRRFSDLCSRRLLLLLAGGLALALAGLVAVARIQGVDSLVLESHGAGPDMTSFTAWEGGQADGALLAPWLGAGIIATLAAVVVHRRGALGDLTPREDIAARRIAVDNAGRISTAPALPARSGRARGR